MDVSKEQVIDQLRQLNMVLVRSRMQVARSQFEAEEEARQWPPAATRTCEPLASRGCCGSSGAPAGMGAPLHGATPDASAPRRWDVVRSQVVAPPRGVTSFRGQGRLLSILGLKPELSQKDLVYLLGMSRQAVGELLGKLEQRGFVEREPSETDRRTMIVRLTDDGREAARRIRESADADAEILDCLSEHELVEFSGYLQRIIDAAEANLPDDEFSERLRAMKEFVSLNHSADQAAEEEGQQ